MSEAATQRNGSFPRIPGSVLEQIIGDGGSGVVYAGRQLYLDRPIAVKVLRQTAELQDPNFVQRFRREAKILAGLRHPHIVTCYQAGITEEGQHYLAMELVNGLDLHQWLVKEGRLSELDAIDVVLKIASALQYALEHGVIHRDVKAENILLHRVGPDDVTFPYEPQLADLGVARPVSAGQATLTLATQLVGTPRNMAPEQFEDPDRVDFRVDLYGLGCVLFQMLTGCHPFPDNDRLIIDKAKVPDPRTLGVRLDLELVDFVRRLLAPQKDHRPKSYGELISTCERLRDQLAAGAARDSPRARWILTGLVAIAISGGVVLVYLSAGTGSPPAPVPSTVTKPVLKALPVLAESSEVIRFEAQGEALLSSDIANPFPGWQPSAGSADWIAEEEGGGVNGIGSGQKARKLGPAPWRLEGSLALLTEKSKEAGIRIELAPGGALVLALKKLDKLYAALVEIPADAESGRPRMLRLLAVDKGLFEQLPFRLAVLKHELRVELGGQPFVELPLDHPVQSIALFVNNATASFRGLAVHRPLS